MAGEKTNFSIIRTKLHQPPVDRICVHRPHLLARLDQHRDRPLTLVSAPAGYGKSFLINCWLESCDIPSAWLSLDESDSDLRLFTVYFIAAIETLFAKACTRTLSLLNAIDLPPMEVLGTSLLNELDRINQPFILVLDDYHLVKEIDIHNLIAQLLKNPPQFFHLVIIGRRDPSLPISSLRAKSKLTEIRAKDLCFSVAETDTLLNQFLGIQIDTSLVNALVKKTEGWVTGLRLTALSMRQQSDINPKLLEPHVDAQYVMEYLFTEIFSEQPPEISRYLLGTAVLNRFCGPLCEAVCAPGAEPFACEIGGWEFIDWLKKESIFVIPLDHEKRWYRYHHLFQKLLLNQLNRQYSAEDINALHAQASVWFAENGLIEEALQHALAGRYPATAAQLVVRHGFNLLNEEQWPRLQRWLGMLPDDMIGQDHELLVLFSWLHVIYSRYPELTSCLKKAEALLSARADSEHLRGHLDTLQSFQQNLALDGEGALSSAQRACERIPRNHRWARLFAFINRAGAHQMLGDRTKAIATLEEVMRDPDLGGGISRGYSQANPCFIYWMEADLPAMLQTAAQSLKAAEDLQAHQAIAHGLYFMGIALYHRNELQAAEEKLVLVVEEPYLQHALNFVHSAFALALVYQARGRTDEADQVGESVVSYGLETKNPTVLQIARAFLAELALRQGRLAEATKWAEHFVAKPFGWMYRFYVPQLTLIRVLLAQDTTDSRDQAADLLTQLYDFVVSIHNTRFQIDLLALKALLYDSQKDQSAALKALTESLTLAEPGGFIRLFVELGPQMADLLKQLVKQNVAVEYIRRILAAFKEDEHRAMQDESDPDGPSSHNRFSLSSSNSAYPLGRRPLWPLRLPARRAGLQLGEAGGRIPNSDLHTSQPLVERLTNRELDVLELLEQRFQNKEIAEKLFISPETVKKHLNNIYGKFNVSSRRQAVEQAEALGILARR